MKHYFLPVLLMLYAGNLFSQLNLVLLPIPCLRAGKATDLFNYWKTKTVKKPFVVSPFTGQKKRLLLQQIPICSTVRVKTERMPDLVRI